MECDPPNFPAMVFQRSEDGQSYFYEDERISVIIIPRVPGVRPGSMHVNFYRRGLSNFSAVYGLPASEPAVPARRFQTSTVALPPLDLGRSSSTPLVDPLAVFFEQEPTKISRTESKPLVEPILGQQPELPPLPAGFGIVYKTDQDDPRCDADLFNAAHALDQGLPALVGRTLSCAEPAMLVEQAVLQRTHSCAEPAVLESVRTFAPCEIAGKQVNFCCGEEYFKAACAVLHIDPTDTEAVLPATIHNLAVLDAVMTAPTPIKCKLSTGGANGLRGFDAAKWDKNSLWIMGKIQEWKFTDPTFHAFIRFLATTAAEHGISQRDVYYYEATDKDAVWGTGTPVAAMHTGILADVDYCMGALDTFEGIIYDRTPSWESKVLFKPAFKGKNGLGKALRSAHLFAMGPDGEFMHETTAEYIDRSGKESTIFAFITPEDGFYNKRPRTDITLDDVRCSSSDVNDYTSRTDDARTMSSM